MEKVEVRNLFVETEKVVAAYKEKAEKLNQQERELNAELIALQDEMTANILDQESASVSELVYLKIQAKEINQKTEIIKVLLEELADERTALKLSFVPLLRQAKAKDANVKAQYDANAIVDRYKWDMFNEIAEIGKQMQKQYREIAPEIMEILDDPKVNEVHRNVRYQFTSEVYKPAYFEANKTVVNREDIRFATGGYLPAHIRKPKGVE